jgi:hypothetical protein
MILSRMTKVELPGIIWQRGNEKSIRPLLLKKVIHIRQLMSDL